jgi:hypothetical protein
LSARGKGITMTLVLQKGGFDEFDWERMARIERDI